MTFLSRFSFLRDIWAKRYFRLKSISYDCGLQHGSERGIAVNYDAEQFNIQPVIDTLVLDSMRRYNKTSAQVLDTYQCYLKVCCQDCNVSCIVVFYFTQRRAYSERIVVVA